MCRCFHSIAAILRCGQSSYMVAGFILRAYYLCVCPDVPCLSAVRSSCSGQFSFCRHYDTPLSPAGNLKVRARRAETTGNYSNITTATVLVILPPHFGFMLPYLSLGIQMYCQQVGLDLVTDARKSEQSHGSVSCRWSQINVQDLCDQQRVHSHSIDHILPLTGFCHLFFCCFFLYFSFLKVCISFYFALCQSLHLSRH